MWSTCVVWSLYLQGLWHPHMGMQTTSARGNGTMDDRWLEDGFRGWYPCEWLGRQVGDILFDGDASTQCAWRGRIYGTSPTTSMAVQDLY